jgi:cephalosporin hydroxylase
MVDQVVNRFMKPYLDRIFHAGDINEHLPVLFTLALQCDTIVEFGVRGGDSTMAFLAGLNVQARKTHLYSYDIAECLGCRQTGVYLTNDNSVWKFTQTDTSKLSEIPPCDLLFVDTLHTYNQVVAELEMAKFAKKWIVFHDTVLFGEHGERGQQGIRPAINTFLARNPEWSYLYEYRHNNGLLIIQKK